MICVLEKINSFVWGTPTLLLIFFTGVILSIRTNFFQIRYFKTAFKTFFKKTGDAKNGAMSPIQSASTALSATMGTGNIVGVAGAVALGGAGAVFWMWVSSVSCMIIKFAEISLSVRYRETNQDGTFSGGAMYYIKNALPNFLHPIGYAFCVCGVAASFGVGNMTQINTMASSVASLARAYFYVSPLWAFVVKLFVGVSSAVCFP